MFRGFVAAKRGTLKEDPDIHERLLIALEGLPAPAVFAALREAPVPPEVLQRASAEDYRRWLGVLAADERGLSALRVVQGDGLNVFLDGGALVLPPRPDVAVPGGEADVSAPVEGVSLAIRPSRAASSKVPLRVGGLVLGLFVWIGLARARPAWRPRLFRLLALLIAPLGLLLVESILTLSGVEPLSAVRPNFNLGGDRAGMRWFEPVGDGSRMQMAKNNARLQAFTVAKPARVVRIVALGGSSVRGKGDLVEFSWPSVMERRLQACAPEGVRVEVINAGADGAVSDDLAVVARNLSAYDPDLFIVYTGYNDFVFVPLMTRFEGYSPARMGLRYQLGRTRIGHVLARAAGRLGPVEGAPSSSSARAEPSTVEVADMRRLLTQNLGQNLRRLAGVAKASGARALFVTQGQNETLCGPGSLNGQHPWDRACFPREARSTILSAASASGVPVVDAAAALRADADGKTVGWSHFWDEIHPGRRGSAVIGEAVAETAREELWSGLQASSECVAPIPARGLSR
jgi:lysophospholipase L1-like esterase